VPPPPADRPQPDRPQADPPQADPPQADRPQADRPQPDRRRSDLPTDAPDAVGSGSRPAAPLPLAIALVALGGALGASSRYEIELALPAGAGAWPWATFAVNVSGALVLGVLLTLLAGGAGGRVGTVTRPLVATGFVGAYTTWSTYMVEVAVLARDGSTAVAAGYLVASLGAGLAAAATGIALGGRLAPSRHPGVSG
jgi:CrcB protein